ncbi:hypothetical protein AAE478_006044 [Parahypoxylon ruwenzoriense]
MSLDALRRQGRPWASTENTRSARDSDLSIYSNDIPPLNIDKASKRSGLHNLDRTGYDEEKCRNVLVRYCAHIPRNYQYKDGIQQIFLILREHLGDENLDLAGGVLYELIEVDCEHTDDPGAAFQRWKHDHLRRYADLELPHVPHMTTITSSIIPTEKLAKWRSQHTSRYPFVLSDSSPSVQRPSIDPSCIRNRKAWLIDHTLYISTRSDGTRPLNSPNPKEFHEMQWNHEYGAQGRLIEERRVSLISPDRPSEMSSPGTADTLLVASNQPKGLRHSLSRLGILEKLTGKTGVHKEKPEVEQRRRSWIPNALVFETPLFKDKRAGSDIAIVPLPDGCQVPNANFARKFLLVGTGDSLPPCLSLSQMPTAESKATETIVEAATRGLLDRAPTWSFRGPFTPQLGFDGGLDYQWTPRQPTITFKRFDVDTSTQDITNLQFDNESEGGALRRSQDGRIPLRTPSKRQGMIFNLETTGDYDDTTARPSTNYTTANISIPDSPETTTPRGIDETVNIALQLNQSPERDTEYGLTLTSNRIGSSIIERHRHGLRRRSSLLFRNVEFTVPREAPESDTPTSNRKFTVVELSSSHAAPNSDVNGGETMYCTATNFPFGLDICRGDERASEDSLGPAADVRKEATIVDRTAACDVQLGDSLLRHMSQGSTVERIRAPSHDEKAGWKCEGRYSGAEKLDCIILPTQLSSHLSSILPIPNTQHRISLSSKCTTSQEMVDDSIQVTDQDEMDTPVSLRAGAPSPFVEQALRERLPATLRYNEEGQCTSLWAWPSNMNVPRENPKATVRENQELLPGNATPLPEPSTGTSDATDTRTRVERIWGWLSSSPGSCLDPELLSPFTDWNSPRSKSLSVFDQPLKVIAPSGDTNASLSKLEPPQPGHRLPDDSASHFSRRSSFEAQDPPPQSDSDLLVKTTRRLSSPLPTAKSEGKHVHFTKSIEMYSTPQKRGRGAPEPDTGGAREIPVPVRATPSRATPNQGERSHPRSQSRYRQELPNSMPQGPNHSRNNSVSSFQTHQQRANPYSLGKGRQLTRKYEFQSSDSDDALSPVPESAMKAQHSPITTMTDIIDRSKQESLPGAPKSVPHYVSPPEPAASAWVEEKRRPEPLDLRNAKRFGKMVGMHTNIQVVHVPTTPQVAERRYVLDDGSSSLYTDSARFPDEPYDSPLLIPKKSELRAGNILQGYKNWREQNASGGQPAGANGQARSKSVSETHNHPDDAPSTGEEPFQGLSPSKSNPGLPKSTTLGKIHAEYDAPPFTPLTQWALTGNTRKAQKTLFGEKGWLEDTAAQDMKKPELQKNASFFDSVKKKARKLAEMADFKTVQPRMHTARELSISLDPREQSLLYCELEFTLSNMLSGYINFQLHTGHLNHHITAKISDLWSQKGRPGVVGFRYDLETQVDLVAEHIGTFRFSGPNRSDQNVIRGLLYGMKTNAREMRVHTFCQPDPVIAKHLVDARALAQLLGSHEQMQISLAEVSAFFQAIIEREKDARLKEEMKNDSVDVAPNSARPPQDAGSVSLPQDAGSVSLSQDAGNVSPPQGNPPMGKFPGECRVKNQIYVPEDQRQFSGPILEPKVYDPSESQPRQRQEGYRGGQ